MSIPLIFKKYIRDGVEVKAVQFTDINKNQVYNTVTELQMNISHGWDTENKPCLIVPNLNGEVRCSFGDYIIIKPMPTDWVKVNICKSDIFDKLYTLVEGIAII